jgi:hypothetical protein
MEIKSPLAPTGASEIATTNTQNQDVQAMTRNNHKAK